MTASIQLSVIEGAQHLAHLNMLDQSKACANPMAQLGSSSHTADSQYILCPPVSKITYYEAAIFNGKESVHYKKLSTSHKQPITQTTDFIEDEEVIQNTPADERGIVHKEWKTPSG